MIFATVTKTAVRRTAPVGKRAFNRSAIRRSAEHGEEELTFNPAEFNIPLIRNGLIGIFVFGFGIPVAAAEFQLRKGGFK
jgi:hypothetical protein